jgi:dUTP pyrophosphatase
MLKVYKIHESACVPFYGTQQAACFDLSASLLPKTKIKYFTSTNVKQEVSVFPDCTIKLQPRCRYLIPTNLIFDIPDGYSVRLHPRSGWSLKEGVTLINCEGVIDSDYVDPIYVAVINNSSTEVLLESGDRIAQAELVRDERAEISEIFEAPTQKSDRDGGFGSTGN